MDVTAAVDLNLIRLIFRELYVAAPGQPPALVASFALSPPSIQGYEQRSEEILDQVDMLKASGLVTVTHRIKMHSPPDPVTLEPTDKAHRWAVAAQDDKSWATASNELEHFLDAYLSESRNSAG